MDLVDVAAIGDAPDIVGTSHVPESDVRRLHVRHVSDIVYASVVSDLIILVVLTMSHRVEFHISTPFVDNPMFLQSVVAFVCCLLKLDDKVNVVTSSAAAAQTPH